MNFLISNKLITLKEQVDVLKIKFKELTLMSYPDSNIEIVINYMSDIANKLDERLSYYNENGINNWELKLISKVIQAFYNMVGYIAKCDVKNHPREIMIPIRELLNNTEKDHIFITEPQWELNYSVGLLMNKNFKEALKMCGIVLEEDINIIKLAFPKLHQDNILGGAIMAHELGHYFDLHYSLELSEKAIVQIINSIDLDKYISNIYSHMKEYTQDLEEMKRILKSNIPNIILRSWIQETVADILGIAFYGLASFLASENLSIYYSDINESQSQFLQQFSITHPRDSFRNYIRIATLAKLGYLEKVDGKILSKLEEYQKQWEESTTAPFRAISYQVSDVISIIVNNRYLLNLENDIKCNLDWIIDFVLDEIKSVSGELIYESDEFVKDIHSLIEKITMVIPPNEIDRSPVNSVSIINSGWISYILNSEDIKNTMGGYNGASKEIDVKNLINSLLKKATLTSNIHRRWINATSQ
ncbi:hypothetical protein JHL18_03530 [Clostridium sp. YIM B02505]|uniref:Uncharacterized protein n=1 Tax=Clostridium yunnanense TaxID=2800325 RepID=A0ABS1EK22_9CLOT|nr:hypothetical protein [Clostridium yunnanense]MBK1809709.1 hypothetical protein [Clostridium yunnanense]